MRWRTRSTGWGRKRTDCRRFSSRSIRSATPGVLTEYVKSFDPRLIALTGTAAQLAAAAKGFHVFHERHDNDDGGYSIDHSAFIYLIDPDGRLAKTVASEGGSKQIAAALSALMNGNH